MKIAVIGLGFMGATHLKALRGAAGVELTAVVSGDPRKLDGDLSGIWGNIAESGEVMDFRGIARYGTLEECLQDTKVEAVDICVPTNLHPEMAIAALRARKHVLVEKPIALDGDSADRMIAEAEQAGRTLMCAQVLRFMGNYRAAAEQLPALGTVHGAMFGRRCGAPGWNQWMRQSSRSGGAVFDLLIHDVDYCVGLFGKPESVTARGFTHNGMGIDWIRAELRYEHAGTVVIDGGWFAPASYPFRAEFTIMAEGGTLEYSSAARPLWLLRADGKESRAFEVAENDAFAEELAYFVECAETGRAPDFCPTRDSAMAVRVMGFMLESRKREGKRVLCSI